MGRAVAYLGKEYNIYLIVDSFRPDLYKSPFGVACEVKKHIHHETLSPFSRLSLFDPHNASIRN